MNTSMLSCFRQTAASWRLRMRAAKSRCGMYRLSSASSVTQNIKARYWRRDGIPEEKSSQPPVKTEWGVCGTSIPEKSVP